jgi:ApbE superfamily uncharacterized protein (UPF0280 family)
MEMGDGEISAMMEKYGDALDDEPMAAAAGEEAEINKNFL